MSGIQIRSIRGRIMSTDVKQLIDNLPSELRNRLQQRGDLFVIVLLVVFVTRFLSSRPRTLLVTVCSWFVGAASLLVKPFLFWFWKGEALQ
jgi:hypothetical protein